MNRKSNLLLVALLAAAMCLCLVALGQNGTPVQPGAPLYSQTTISSTAAVNNQVTLTIPAPPAGWYNYVCDLSYHASQDGTATAQTNAVTTSTNFNSFAKNRYFSECRSFFQNSCC